LNKSQSQLSFTVALILIATNLRMAIISIPPLTSILEQGLHMSQPQIGMLTSIPLICFGIFSVIIGALAQKWNVKVLIASFLALLMVFNFLRVYNQTLLYIGTFAVGLSITALNVLIPVIVLQSGRTDTNRLNGIYTATFNVCAAVVSLIIVPLAHLISWQIAIQLLSLPALIALIGWTMTPQNHQPAPAHTAQPLWHRYGHFITTRQVWFLTFFFGFQSLIFYVTSAWLPSIMTSHGMSSTLAGIFFGIFQFIGVPASYFAPQLMSSREQLHRMFWLIGIGYLLGFALLALNTGRITDLLACLSLGITSSASFAMALTLITMVSPTPQDAGVIGGIVQSCGYLIASSGPLLAGIMIKSLGNWLLILGVLGVIAILLLTMGLSLVRNVDASFGKH
jgi:Cyanate permease